MCDLACLNAWSYDRWMRRARSRPPHSVRVDSGDRYVVCDGHAMTARLQITDGRVLPCLPACPPDRTENGAPWTKASTR